MSDYIELPDGSGVSTMSFPLKRDHWIYQQGQYDPPAGMRTFTDDPMREGMEEAIRAGAEWAIRGTTMSGKDMDFDPDAMVQNLIVGLLGYYETKPAVKEPDNE